MILSNSWKEGDFTSLVGTFKYTLILLFIGLIYSLVSYGNTNYLNEANLNGDKQPKWFLVLFVFLFFYSLFATFNSAKDAIYFSAFETQNLLELKKKGIS